VLPNVIDDGETIVRAIKTPYHAKKGQLLPAAFRPAPAQNKLSVMRQGIGNDNCKAAAVKICGDDYYGLATLSAGRIRDIGPQLEDAPDEYEGHAHICYDFALTKGVPATPEQNKCFAELAKHANFEVDPAPQSPGWSGSDLVRS
jgi:hypothetical protein